MLSIISLIINLLTLAIVWFAVVKISRARTLMDRTHAKRLVLYAQVEAQQMEAAFRLLDAQEH